MRFGASLTILSAACALAACSSSPTSRFYTLAGPSGANTQTATAATVPFYFELAPVDMPQQVAKNQLVVQTSPAQVKVLEEDRWASLPADEVRRALSADLTQRLGSIDVYGTSRPETASTYRVKVNVQRFESWPGAQAVIDAVWSVRAAGSDTVMTCRTVATERVGDGYDALVDGHRKAVDEVATAIAAGVRSLRAMPAPVAPSSSAKGKSAAAPRPAPTVACPSSGAITNASAQ